MKCNENLGKSILKKMINIYEALSVRIDDRKKSNLDYKKCKKYIRIRNSYKNFFLNFFKFSYS